MRAPWQHFSRSWSLPNRHYSSRPLHPLRILFCGSDDFSITSLRALAALPPSLISSIDVVSRTPKPTGRGLRKLATPPIHAAASSLGLTLHSIPTFTHWQPPPVDLIIAVSFGLLVPPRLLSAATYGGINVHPSFLPDLAGPAPVHWALLNGDSHAGVTVQTLHPSRFDGGRILAQTPRPGLALAGHDLTSATAALADAGAELLVQCIKYGSFAGPGREQQGEGRHARKLRSEDARLDATWTCDEVRRRAMVLGPLWEDEVHEAITGKRKRVQYEGWEEIDVQGSSVVPLTTANINAFVSDPDGSPRLGFTCAGPSPRWLAPRKVKIEGETWKDASTLARGFAKRT